MQGKCGILAGQRTVPVLRDALSAYWTGSSLSW